MYVFIKQYIYNYFCEYIKQNSENKPNAKRNDHFLLETSFSHKILQVIRYREHTKYTFLNTSNLTLTKSAQSHPKRSRAQYTSQVRTHISYTIIVNPALACDETT